ncbi:DUF3592 domain-containing protein [Falsiroseomonas sp.]|uniref:DUF3592 domain-containing protein n=1 Tax=Falsiroseomonas sp. TaxID=2870721 RepID=UPI0035679EF6
MHGRNNPWAPRPAAPSPPPAGTHRALRAFWWLCAGWVALATPLSIAEDARLLATTEQVTGIVLAHDEPGGAPEAIHARPPLAPGDIRLRRQALRFTTAAGQDVTVAVAVSPLPWRTVTPGSAITIRYDPESPATRPILRSGGEILGSLILDALGAWIMIPAFIRVARGATLHLRTLWPPWPWRGLN